MEDCMYQTTDGLMEVRIQHVTFSKVLKGGEILIHHARIITDTDLGDAYSQSASDGNEKETDAFLEFLRTCHHDADYAYVLC